jgi:hypothetical protein
MDLKKVKKKMNRCDKEKRKSNDERRGSDSDERRWKGKEG